MPRSARQQMNIEDGCRVCARVLDQICHP